MDWTGRMPWIIVDGWSWHGYLSWVRCIWFAYGPVDAIATKVWMIQPKLDWVDAVKSGASLVPVVRFNNDDVVEYTFGSKWKCKTLYEWFGAANLLEKHRNEHLMNIGNKIFTTKTHIKPLNKKTDLWLNVPQSNTHFAETQCTKLVDHCKVLLIFNYIRYPRYVSFCRTNYCFCYLKLSVLVVCVVSTVSIQKFRYI